MQLKKSNLIPTEAAPGHFCTLVAKRVERSRNANLELLSFRDVEGPSGKQGAGSKFACGYATETLIRHN